MKRTSRYRLVLLSFVVVLLSSCNVYRAYNRTDSVETDSLYRSEYRELLSADSTSTLEMLSWRELYQDQQLQRLIERGLEQNKELKRAEQRIEAARAALVSARLAFLPSLSFEPSGTIASFDHQKATKTYQLPLVSSWNLFTMGETLNKKRASLARWELSKLQHEQAQSNLIAHIASAYYTLIMLDDQLEVTVSVMHSWEELIKAMEALVNVGMVNEVAINRTRSHYISSQIACKGLLKQIQQVENALCLLLGDSSHTILRAESAASPQFPTSFSIGVPLQLLNNRADVKVAERMLESSFYDTNTARAAFYPHLRLNGVFGWTNLAGQTVVNPAKMIASAIGSLTQPIFNKGVNRARLKMAKAQQEEMKLNFEQSLLNAGKEVNDALISYQTAAESVLLHQEQLTVLQQSASDTRKLFNLGSATYLEVITGEQEVLQAKLNNIANTFAKRKALIDLYTSLGGGTMEQK